MDRRNASHKQSLGESVGFIDFDFSIFQLPIYTLPVMGTTNQPDRITNQQTNCIIKNQKEKP